MITLPAPYYTSEKQGRKFIGADWLVRVFYLEQPHGARWPAFDIRKQSMLHPKQWEPKVKYCGKLLDGTDNWVEYDDLDQLVMAMVTKHRMLKR